MKSIVGWLGRKGLLFLALTAAMLAYAVWRSGDIEALRQEPEMHERRAADLVGLAGNLEALRQQRQSELRALGTYVQTQSEAQLRARLATEKKQRDQLIEKTSGFSNSVNIVTMNVAAIAADRKRTLELAFVEKKIAGLTLALENGTRRRTSAQRVLTAEDACKAADRRLNKFNSQNKAVKTIREIAQGGWSALREQRKTACREATLRRKAHESLAGAKAWVDSDLPLAVDDLRNRAVEERQLAQDALSAKAVRWAGRYHLVSLLRAAAIALTLIILSPFVVRIICFYFLAPIAMRGNGIHLSLPGEAQGPMPTGSPSSASVAVRLAPGEELLVRQDFLQTTSQGGTKQTQWCLDWRHPLTSLAAGLTFLTRIRGEGETTTVSAVHDPFAEVAIVTLSEGASCVLHPRALAAVVQPINQPLAIRSEWRLGSLSPWLTLQLRYLVFEGPCRLVVKGGRGVRVEQAEHGRIFGQDQLVGFSANLAYSVTRTETFWPYFLGREALLKDRVVSGEGVLIIEEAPFTGRNRGEAPRGIEGMVDAGMKAFGL